MSIPAAQAVHDLGNYCPTVHVARGYSHAGKLVHDGQRESPDGYAERMKRVSKTKFLEALGTALVILGEEWRERIEQVGQTAYPEG